MGRRLASFEEKIIRTRREGENPRADRMTFDDFQGLRGINGAYAAALREFPSLRPNAVFLDRPRGENSRLRYRFLQSNAVRTIYVDARTLRVSEDLSTKP